MRCALEQCDLTETGRNQTRQVGQFQRRDRQAFLAHLFGQTILGSQGNRVAAARELIGQLPGIPADGRLLVDLELLDEVLAEIEVELGGLVAAASRYGRILQRDFLLPFGVEQVFDGFQFARLDLLGVDMKRRRYRAG